MEKDFKQLIANIAEEHYDMTSSVDKNLNYLWYMYYKGSKKGDFRPFIFMAELMLLNKFNYLSKSEIKNIIAMMKSEDRDNLNIVTLTIKNLRELRIKEHGIYSNDNNVYNEVKLNYAYEIVNHSAFTTVMKKV
jgi:hypothetical protein